VRVILVAVIVGLFAGWLVGLIGRDRSFSLVGTLTMAVFGGILGEALLPLTGFNLDLGIAGQAINAGLGAMVSLFIVKLLRSDDDPFPAQGDKP
jgi:uncharacterized membrane protein YeaQ/YmgE (transglycosylase-associated protein family)